MFAGGLVTNTNQSASWVRLPSRNASTDIDAAYFNPAGLMKLENGFHISVSNQSIWQTRKITNAYYGPSSDVAPTVPNIKYGLNQHTYKGTVTAPLFPSLFAVYKMDNFAFSLGFGPVGGGGRAIYKSGLPSFEMAAADLVPLLASKAGVREYKLNTYFEGTSTFLGYQAGVSYKINDKVSVGAGVRLVTAKNTYEGYLKDIQLNVGGTFMPASIVLSGLAAKLTSITTIPNSLAGAISGGYGSLTLAQLVGAGAMTTQQKAGIEAGLAAIGVPAANIPLMNVATISGVVTSATPALNAQAAELSASAASPLLGNQSADVEQTGTGFSPFFSINLSPSEYVNIAIKYEMRTKLEVKNSTTQDLIIGFTGNGTPITMFPQGEVTRNDMPAMLSVGADFKLTQKLKLSLGGNYFFDKNADYGHTVDADLDPKTPKTHIANKDIIAQNGVSIQGGLEYNISEKFLVSGGYIWANKGVNDSYQSDLTYGLGTQTFGLGGAYNVNKKIQINLGAGYTRYKDDGKNVYHSFSSSLGSRPYMPWESYRKSTFMVAVGVDLHF